MAEIDEKWIKSKSTVQSHLQPVELPLEAPEGFVEPLKETDLLAGLETGKLQVLQIPPYAFGGNFLEEQDVDEQGLESLEGLNYSDRYNILRHLIGIEYDGAGYPLVDSLQTSIERQFNNKKGGPFKIGKLVKFDDGSVEFVAEKSGRVFDVLESPDVTFHREFVTFDDEQKTFMKLRETQSQYTTCLKLDQ